MMLHQTLQDSLLGLFSVSRPHGTKSELALFAELQAAGWTLEYEHGYPSCAWFNPSGSDTWLTAHADTVGALEGHQQVIVQNGIAGLAKPKAKRAGVLGADCGTGVAIIHHLSMLRQDLGYIIFAGEECGCIGSRAVSMSDHPINSAKAIISLDRKGTKDVITHQMGRRTCAANYAEWLAAELEMKPSSGGVYTDSNEFADTCYACTNISVGYYDQHRSCETQDMAFAERLLGLLERIDFEHSPMPESTNELSELAEYIKLQPRRVANILLDYGLTIEDFKHQREPLDEPWWPLDDEPSYNWPGTEIEEPV